MVREVRARPPLRLGARAGRRCPEGVTLEATRVSYRLSIDERLALLEKAQEIARLGSWMAELDGSRRLFLFPEAERILGVPAGETVDSFDRWLTYVHADDRAAVNAAIAAA